MSELVGVSAGKFVKFAPLIAGRVPDKFAAGKLVRFAPLAAGKVAGNLASGIVPDAKSDASKFVRFAPLIAGRGPDNDVASKFVRFAPLIAGKAPDNFDAVSVDILASATVPVNCPAGILVRDAPEPEKVVAVTTPALPR